jgi:hypothetical protein
MFVTELGGGGKEMVPPSTLNTRNATVHDEAAAGMSSNAFEGLKGKEHVKSDTILFHSFIRRHRQSFFSLPMSPVFWFGLCLFISEITQDIPELMYEQLYLT